MSYIVLVMQPQPKNINQIFMTAIGLVLLVMALVLNHRHPHNEGIAAMPHNSIYHLQLNVAQAADQAAGFGYQGRLGLPRSDSPAVAAAPSAQNEQQAVIMTAAATSITASSAEQCRAGGPQTPEEAKNDNGAQANSSPQDNNPQGEGTAADNSCTPAQLASAPSDK